MLEEPRRVEKPWGYELVWADTQKYAGKILHVFAGEALSLQYHEVKEETLFLLTGQLLVQAGPSPSELVNYEMAAGQCFRIPATTVHRMVATTDCDIVEVSTPHLKDIVRLEDRYGRVAPSQLPSGR